MSKLMFVRPETGGAALLSIPNGHRRGKCWNADLSRQESSGAEKANARIVSDPGTRVTIARQPPILLSLYAPAVPPIGDAEQKSPRTTAIACVSELEGYGKSP